MLVIRPLQENDLDDLYAMAQGAGKGLTTLPADRELLQKKINHARETFNQRIAPEAGLYLFALEDIERKKNRWDQWYSSPGWSGRGVLQLPPERYGECL